MTDIVVGIDHSTKRIDIGIVPLLPDATGHIGYGWLKVALPDFAKKPWRGTDYPPTARSAIRCEIIGTAFRDALERLHERTPIREVWIEEPHGTSGFAGNKDTDNKLREGYGALLASVPAGIARCGVQTKHWRAGLGGVFPTHVHRPDKGRKTALRTDEAKAISRESAERWLRHVRASGSPTLFADPLPPLTIDECEALLIAVHARRVIWSRDPSPPVGLTLPWETA